MATLLRCASSNISSGSSDPSIWRCSSALGSAAMNAARASREAKPSGTWRLLLPKDDRRLGLVAADFLDRQPVDLVREDQPLVGFVDRSEEHTSELQSLMRRSYAVFCFKQKKIHHIKL